MAEKLFEAFGEIGTKGDKETDAKLGKLAKSLDRVRALLVSGPLKEGFKGILGDGADKVVEGIASGFAAAGIAGAAAGAAMGAFNAVTQQTAETMQRLNQEFRVQQQEARTSARIMESLGQAFREVAQGGGAAASQKVISARGQQLDAEIKKLDELRAKEVELRQQREVEQSSVVGSGARDKFRELTGGIGVSEQLDDTTAALRRQEVAVARVREQFEAAKSAAGKAQLGELKDSLFGLGLNEPERAVAAVAKQYDDLTKQARLLNVTEEERVSILADINTQREAALDKVMKEQKAQNDIAGKLMGIDQIARSFQAQEIAKPKEQARQPMLDKILAGPLVPALAAADAATEANTMATERLTTSIQALRNGQLVAAGARIGPGE